ncbi:MAG: FGGY-family carbohydrate kinase [Actinomycetota bacterium]|nr:FGGY-family carbohydrate kinase [Actinomycetota bacterium]
MTLPSGAAEGAYLRSMAAMAGAEVISMHLIGLDNPGWLSDLAADTGPGSGGLVFHPYLSPAGERAPFRDANARGPLVGLSFEHSRSHLARSMLEAMSYVIRDCLDFSSTPVTELRLCGGGANSAFWCQLLADVTGVPTARSVDAEIGAKGAFLTGLVATGLVPNVTEAVDAYVHTRDVFQPDPRTAKTYDDLYADFLATRDSARAAWPRLVAARSRLEVAPESDSVIDAEPFRGD